MRRASLGSLLVLLGSCGDAPALAGWTSAATETPHGSTGTGTGDSTTGSQPGTGTTEAPDTDDGETAAPPDAGGSSTGSTEPVPPVALLEVTLTPEQRTVEGPIVAQALAEHADGVRIQVDDGDPVELAEVAPGEFVGELAIFTALDNGIHDVVFLAWRGDETAPPRLVQFEAKLKPAGTEAYWDASGVLGVGFARGVAVDQAADWVFELGDTKINDDAESHCFVRRRGAAGDYLEADIRDVLPGQTCTARAISIADDGTLHLLAEAEINGLPTWWLGRKDSWDAPTLTIAWGAPGEKAYAVAQHPDQPEVAVCGTVPTNEIDIVDGMVAIFRENMPGYRPPPFDYKPGENVVHIFGETLYDCAYHEDVLVLAGQAFGPHEGINKKQRDRLVLIEYDVESDAALWTFAGPGPGPFTQSGARALAITDDGTYLTFGHACEDTCKPLLHLREFLPGGVPSGWNVLPAVSAALVTDLVWSPAGYAVLAAGKVNGPWWTEFWLQAWVPGDEAPVWSYSHVDQPGLHGVLAIAAAKFARIYAVGVAGQGDLAVPAFAIVNP